MNNIYLFSDASCNPSKNKSIGCYTLVTNLDIVNLDSLDIHTYEMDFSSSTMAELMTIKQALTYAHERLVLSGQTSITLFTDCENFINLIQKRQHKEQLKNHTNYELYKELIDLVALHDTNIIWTKGHDKKDNKNELYQQIFSVLDKTARRLAREF